MAITRHKKLIIFPAIFFVFFSKPIFPEQLINRSQILRKSSQCFKDFQNKVCSNLLLEMEKIQLVENAKNRYKCQTSILGLQTELIEAHYFKNLKKKHNVIMIPYVIKNC